MDMAYPYPILPIYIPTSHSARRWRPSPPRESQYHCCFPALSVSLLFLPNSKFFCFNFTLQTLSKVLRSSSIVKPRNSLHCPAFKFRNYCLFFMHSSSRSSSLFSSELFTLKKRQFLSVLSPGSSSVLHSGIHSSNRFTNTYSPFKNRFPVYFSSWFSLPSSTHNIYSVLSNSGWPHSWNLIRFYTISPSNSRFIPGPVAENEVRSSANASSKQLKLVEQNKFSCEFVLEIVDILRNNGNDVESRLTMLHSRFSLHLITDVFEVLNCLRVSGLRFFGWIRSNNPQLHKNAFVCSLVIDNLGRLDDYETMSALFKKFTSEKICLSYEAFRFLSVVACTDSSLKESTKRVVNLMNGVGGSCRSSGICALIEMFCKLRMFDMAKYVIKITESKISYYCLVIREECKSGLIEDAFNVIKEMRQAHCAPNTTVYNFILGSLWKNGRMNEASALLDEMRVNGVPQDAITFEILINFSCDIGDMDVVRHLLDQMLSQGLEPRLSTHACIIKSLFAAEKYEAAHKYVVDSSIIFKTSSNMMYSFLVKLYQEKGDILSARNTLVEMMEKNLKPDFSIFVKILKQLRRTGKTNLARDLEIWHSKFVIKSGAGIS